MGFLKQLSTETLCRICGKSFCCKGCRSKHEKGSHDIEPACDICVYGRISISLINRNDIANHIKASHLPLHCLFCYKTFNLMEEIQKHDVACSRPNAIKGECSLESLSKTPIRQDEKENFLSPPVNDEIRIRFVTSTPNVNGLASGENKIKNATPELAQNVLTMAENITPVIGSDGNDVQIQSEKAFDIDKPSSSTLESSKCAVNNKRRVTFSDTPSLEHQTSRKTRSEFMLKSSLKKCTFRRLNIKESTESVINVNDVISFTTKNVSESKQVLIDEDQIVTTSTTTTKMTKRRASLELNRTLWESASEDINADIFDDRNENGSDFNAETKIVREIGGNKKTNSNDFAQPSVSQTEDSFALPENVGVWTAMTLFVKCAMGGFKTSLSQSSTTRNTIKRHHIQTESDYVEDRRLQKLKRLKLTDIKCRPSIRNNSVLRMDKATQTDDILFFQFQNVPAVCAPET